MPERAKSKLIEKEPQYRGMLVILTGPSGAGKDTAFKRLLESEVLSQLKPRRAVTMASREPREKDGEIEGVHYYFRTLEFMKEMAKQKSYFMEELTQTGETFKATPTSEIISAINDNDVVMLRIDMSRAGEIAKGVHFNKFYDADTALIFNKRALVVCVDIDRSMTKEEITKRRRDRDGASYNQSDYDRRDADEAEQMEKYKSHYHYIVENKNNRLDDTIRTIEEIILNFASNQEN